MKTCHETAFILEVENHKLVPLLKWFKERFTKNANKRTCVKNNVILSSPLSTSCHRLKEYLLQVRDRCL